MIDVAQMLQALEGDSPTGPDLDADADVAYSTFVNATAVGKQEQGVGDQVIPAEDPDWNAVEKEAVELFARSKDLRLAVPLTQALTARAGLDGLAQGISLIRGLVEQYWESCHPRLEGADDPFRVLRLADLNADSGLLKQFNAAVFAEARAVGRFTFREVALATGAITPREGETSPSPAMLAGALKEGDPEITAKLLPTLDQTIADLEATTAAFLSQGNGSPDFDKLLAGLKRAAKLAAEALALTPAESANAEATGTDDDVGGGTGGPGRLRNRADAKRALETVCEFLERTEPGHPAPLFVRRAVRLLDMSFIDIIKDMAPDSLARIHDLGGVAADAPAE